MRYFVLNITLLLLSFFTLKSQQVGIGTKYPNSNAILDVSDSSRGVLLPRISTAARVNLPNTKGMIAFDTVTAGYWYNDGSAWINLPSKGKSVGDMLFWNGNQWASVPSGMGGQVLTLSTGTHIPAWKGPTTDTAFIDPRDGKQYKMKQIGTQIWMTENLNHFQPGMTCYNNNCDPYGGLYNYYEAMDAAPPGWHIPSNAEWDTLINFLGGPLVAGGAMKATILWNAPNTGATNSSGFNALPGGWATFGGHNWFWNFMYELAFFWSSTNSEGLNFGYLLSYGSADIRQIQQPWPEKLSVRCIKDY
jgi:uncharacterized protein (TIGR02145 family)